MDPFTLRALFTVVIPKFIELNKSIIAAAANAIEGTGATPVNSASENIRNSDMSERRARFNRMFEEKIAVPQNNKQNKKLKRFYNAKNAK